MRDLKYLILGILLIKVAILSGQSLKGKYEWKDAEFVTGGAIILDFLDKNAFSCTQYTHNQLIYESKGSYVIANDTLTLSFYEDQNKDKIVFEKKANPIQDATYIETSILNVGIKVLDSVGIL